MDSKWFDLANKIFVIDKTISSWEFNRTEPSLETIIKLSEPLDCNASYLIYGNTKKNDIETEIKIKLSENEFEEIEIFMKNNAKFLNESRKGNMLGFIKFFLQCIIEQCNNYIAKINRIKQIYKTDMEKIKSLNSNAVYRMMPQIVFTKKEIEEEPGVSRNTVSTLID